MLAGITQIPISLLVEPGLTAAAKVAWIAMRALPRPAPASRLAAASGLTPPTIRSALAQLLAGGWYTPSEGVINRFPVSESVLMPRNLLADLRLHPRAKLAYGILQIITGSHGRSGAFSYAHLSNKMHVSTVTARNAIQALNRAGWIQARQAHQLAPVYFTLRHPEQDRRDAEVAQAKLRLEAAHYRGEAIMKEFLSLLIESDEFEDNARPGFLANPLTGERMELDRYYPPITAFEFHGAQHYRTTSRYPSPEALAMQQSRDLMKEALCTRRGIRIVVVNGEDLNLKTMQEKVGTLLPLRDLQGREELIEVLRKAGKSYQE